MQLCYIQGNFAYFTNDPEKQWGDDWDDAPYEHNAGEPYTHNGQTIEILAFRTDLVTPAERFYPNSNYSVQDINDGNFPWLSGTSSRNLHIDIYAGATKEEFIQKILESGGEVYVPYKEA